EARATLPCTVHAARLQEFLGGLTSALPHLGLRRALGALPGDQTAILEPHAPLHRPCTALVVPDGRDAIHGVLAGFEAGRGRAVQGLAHVLRVLYAVVQSKISTRRSTRMVR